MLFSERPADTIINLSFNLLLSFSPLKEHVSLSHITAEPQTSKAGRRTEDCIGGNTTPPAYYTTLIFHTHFFFQQRITVEWKVFQVFAAVL